MIKLSKHDQDRVMASINEGRIDMAGVTETHLVDDCLLSLWKNGIVQGIADHFADRRKRKGIPFLLVMLLAIAAKMKTRQSMRDIPFAIASEETLREFGYAMWDENGDVQKGLMDEGSIRTLVGKYQPEEWFTSYNSYVQESLLPKLDIKPSIHIHDCTKLEVNLSNENYEGATIVKDQEGAHRGYKLATLRGICGDRGVIEEICFGEIHVHDFKLSEEMVKNSKVFSPGDILICDRGFISRDLINYMKSERKVDVYIPLRKGMEAYEQAIAIANESSAWYNHPNTKRKNQRIALVKTLEAYWRSDNPREDVAINACVVKDMVKEEYYVFVTTDTKISATQIIKTYELRPEIEEDYRQIKDFWEIERFRSHKLTVTAFHIVCTMLGYLMYQIYGQMQEGEEYAGKSLPVAIKRYKRQAPRSIIICVGEYFAVFGFLEFIKIYSSLEADLRSRLDEVLALV
jgi:hypothetical protein